MCSTVPHCDRLLPAGDDGLGRDVWRSSDGVMESCAVAHRAGGRLGGAEFDAVDGDVVGRTDVHRARQLGRGSQSIAQLPEQGPAQVPDPVLARQLIEAAQQVVMRFSSKAKTQRG